MNKITFLLLASAQVFGARDANAKAAYMSSEVMIANSDAIVIVQINQVSEAKVKGEHWTFGQKAVARVEQTLKGTLPVTPTLLGDEDFICARCHFEKGRYLVFLKRENSGWRGVNWERSACEIENGMVRLGPSNNKPKKLSEALAEIQQMIKTQRDSPRFSLVAGIQGKVRFWTVSDAKKASVELQLKQPEFEAWLCKLEPGTKVDLCNSCRGNNATPEEIANLRSYAEGCGLNFVVIPAG